MMRAPLKLRDYADLCLPRLHKSQITSQCGSRIIAVVSLTWTAMTQDLAMSTSLLTVPAYSPYSLWSTGCSVSTPCSCSLCTVYYLAKSKQSHIINTTAWRSHISVEFVQLLNEWPAAQVSPQRRKTVSGLPVTGWPVNAASWTNLHIT